MSEPYYSRRYLSEKLGALVYDMVEFLEVGRWEDLGDRIEPKTMDRCRDNIVDKCKAIVGEVTKTDVQYSRVLMLDPGASSEGNRVRAAAELRSYGHSDLKGGSLLKTLKDVTGTEDGSWRDVLLGLADLIEPVAAKAGSDD